MAKSSTFISLFICLYLFATSLSAQDRQLYTHTKSFPLSDKWSLDFVIKSPYKEPCPESSKRHHFGIYYGDQIKMEIVNQYDGRIFLARDYRAEILVPMTLGTPRRVGLYTSDFGEIRIDSTNSIALKSYTEGRVFYIDFSISRETETRPRRFWGVFGVDIKPY